MNVLSIVGHLGSDARQNNVSGTAVLNFSVPCKSGFGDKAQTIWVDCALWGKQAESKLVDYMKKGQQVAVSGEMGTRTHEGKTYITMRVNTITLCGSASGSGTPQPAQQPAKAAPVSADMDEDFPF